MPRVPIINFNQMEKILKRNGFYPSRQKGSHVFFKHEDGRATSVPNHPGKDLSRALILSILRDIQMTTYQFIDELQK